MVGQEHLLGPSGSLRALVEADRVSSMILWGPPGTGKTTLARLIATATSKEFVALSAVAAGVKDVREVIDAARRRLGEKGMGTILFLDEVHRFNKAQQDVLLPAVEEGLIILIGATTENPFFEVNAPLLSRSTLFRTVPLDPGEIETLARRALSHEQVEADEDALAHLVQGAGGDARGLLGSLEVAISLASLRAARSVPVERHPDQKSVVRVALADAEAARGTQALRYGVDEHYDVASAFIKSVRGSDPDAGLYWLARMIEAGEDARFIARRLVILASEDVGLADPSALLAADAAARAVEFVGLPEALLNLAQATVHLACAPKSTRVTVALGRARADASSRSGGDVPVHLRDSHYRGAEVLGHGQGYDYPHNDPSGWVAQAYRPDDVAENVYYEPSDHGHEKEIARAMKTLGKDQHI